MKKILALALALLIVASTAAMTACGNKNNDDPKDPDTQNPVTDPSVVTFTSVEERTRATVTVEIRIDPAMDVDNVIGSLRVGEIVTRTGISTDGTWSRIHMSPAGFEEGDYYVASNCLEIYTGPEQPEDPENPDDPTNPENPDDPANPDDPTDPEQPEDPENPEDPDTPDEPETPSFTAVEAYTWANPFVNMRAQADPKAAVVTTLGFGTKVLCVAKSGSWIEVVYGEYSGFVKATYLTLVNPDASDFTVYAEPKTMVVNTEGLTVRYYPFSVDVNDDLITSEDSIFGYVSNGDEVTVTGASADGKWASIRWMDGRTFYVYAKYLSGFTGGTTPSNPGTQTPAVTFTTIAPAIMYPKTSNVRYYSEADVLTAAAGTLSMSDTVKCIAMSNDGVWFKVNLQDNDTPYYIMQKDLQSNGK